MSAVLRALTPLAFALALGGTSPTAAEPAVPEGPADAEVDLATREGVALVGGAWRVHEARVVDVEFRSVGPDLKPSGPPNRTQDIEPRAGAADFDDSGWEQIDPTTLAARRSTGRICFEWYRIAVTIPERIDGFDPTGSTVVFEIVIDDYAEVWVDGQLPWQLGQRGGTVVAGFNAPNRVAIARDARPGQRVQVAVFGMNGPVSLSPQNFIWVRSAKLHFYREPRAIAPVSVGTRIERLDPAIDALVPKDARLERVAEGFQFIEGPVWLADQRALLFSDANANRIWRYAPDEGLALFREKSGYQGADVAEYRQPGSNGLALDPGGRLTVAEHGNHRISRLEHDGSTRVLADAFGGKRLNSPNDLVYRSDGALYFSDPPFGLPGFFDDPRKELPYSGVFLWKDGALRLVAKELRGPNGVALSPDERFLYVTNWDEKKKVVMRYPVGDDGALGRGAVLFDMGAAPEPEALDGIEVDRRGNLYVSGPGGLWILSADGKHLGTIRGPELPANFAWGDVDARTLYLTARTGLYRLRLREPGIRPEPAPAVERHDARLDAVIPRDARLEKLADGFAWVEGPVWDAASGALLFSDIPTNSVFRWSPALGVRLFLRPSGYSGAAPFRGREPGANGLAFDAEGRLVLCEHGDRRITRLERDGTRTVLADRYRGKRLNSPNDVALRPDGELWFTDPPFGLPEAFADPARELSFTGVFRRTAAGDVVLATDELSAPNGIGFSPDGKTLYVSNADRSWPVWMTYPVREDGSLGEGRVFADGRAWLARFPGVPDGLDVDAAGNVFAAGPGGVYVFAPDGTHLGTLRTGVATSNVAFDADGAELYITADRAVHRIRLVPQGRVEALAR
jgi:gluconolactonase